ncbi:MAG: PLDc_N domain-containing protein [Clostridia bacterium]|nr:PLDc_N domain-containing protein [Clostridia bacterium]
MNLSISKELILALVPIIIIQLSLQIFCIISIVRKGVANLNKAAWIAIVLLVNFIGAILYLAIGRRKDA